MLGCPCECICACTYDYVYLFAWLWMRTWHVPCGPIEGGWMSHRNVVQFAGLGLVINFKAAIRPLVIQLENVLFVHITRQKKVIQSPTHMFSNNVIKKNAKTGQLPSGHFTDSYRKNVIEQSHFFRKSSYLSCKSLNIPIVHRVNQR